MAWQMSGHPVDAHRLAGLLRVGLVAAGHPSAATSAVDADRFAAVAGAAGAHQEHARLEAAMSAQGSVDAVTAGCAETKRGTAQDKRAGHLVGALDVLDHPWCPLGTEQAEGRPEQVRVLPVGQRREVRLGLARRRRMDRGDVLRDDPETMPVGAQELDREACHEAA